MGVTGRERGSAAVLDLPPRSGRCCVASKRWPCARASVTLVVNEREREVAQDIGPSASVAVVENGVDLEQLRPSEPPSCEPVVVFCGVMDYAPNVEGAVWLARKVWPIVRSQRPDARLEIVGAHPARAVRALEDSTQGIHITGSVPDVRPYLWKAAVGVAPLHTARGVQNKVLEAVAAGLPVVVTPEVAAGLPPQVASACVSAETVEKFAAQVVTWLSDNASERRRLAEYRRPGPAGLGNQAEIGQGDDRKSGARPKTLKVLLDPGSRYCEGSPRHGVPYRADRRIPAGLIQADRWHPSCVGGRVVMSNTKPVSQFGRRQFLTTFALGAAAAPLVSLGRSTWAEESAPPAASLCYSNKRVLRDTDLRYLGAMRVPGDGPRMDFSYGHMTGRRVNGQVQLIMSGNVVQRDPIYEFADTGAYHPDPAQAPRMPLIKEWGDIYGGLRGSWDQQGAVRTMEGRRPGGLHWNEASQLLYWTYHETYNVTQVQDWCLGASRLTPSGAVAFGPWRPSGDGKKGPWRCLSVTEHPSGEMLCGSRLQSGNAGSPWGPDLWVGSFPTQSTPAGINAPDLPIRKYLTYYPMIGKINPDGSYNGPVRLIPAPRRLLLRALRRNPDADRSAQEWRRRFLDRVGQAGRCYVDRPAGCPRRFVHWGFRQWPCLVREQRSEWLKVHPWRALARPGHRSSLDGRVAIHDHLRPGRPRGCSSRTANRLHHQPFTNHKRRDEIRRRHRRRCHNRVWTRPCRSALRCGEPKALRRRTRSGLDDPGLRAAAGARLPDRLDRLGSSRPQAGLPFEFDCAELVFLSGSATAPFIYTLF